MKKTTPLEKLQADKKALQTNIKELEHQLGESWSYIKDNAGGVFIYGIKYLLFPQKRGLSKDESKSKGILTSMSGYLHNIKEIFPIVWPVLHPLYLSWVKRKQCKKNDSAE